MAISTLASAPMAATIRPPQEARAVHDV